MNSYQHSYPHVDTTWADDDESPPPRRRPSWKLKLAVVMVLGVLFVAALAAFDRSDSIPEQPLLMKATKTKEPEQPSTQPMEPERPQSTSEGDYDWKKCKESSDPNCWKNEGERVGGYWQNFGQKMKAWGQAMHSFWANLFKKKEQTATSEEE